MNTHSVSLTAQGIPLLNMHSFSSTARGIPLLNMHSVSLKAQGIPLISPQWFPGTGPRFDCPRFDCPRFDCPNKFDCPVGLNVPGTGPRFDCPWRSLATLGVIKFTGALGRCHYQRLLLCTMSLSEPICAWCSCSSICEPPPGDHSSPLLTYIQNRLGLAMQAVYPIGQLCIKDFVGPVADEGTRAVVRAGCVFLLLVYTQAI